jgi:hypothetical protein
VRAIVLALLVVALPAGAQMYKCADDKGLTRYTDTPCPGGKGKQVNIQPIPSLSGAAPSAPSQDVKRQDADFKRRQVERAQAEAAGRAEQERHCARLRREHGILAGGGRVAKVLPSGERVFIDDATRDGRLAELKQALRECP